MKKTFAIAATLLALANVQNANAGQAATPFNPYDVKNEFSTTRPLPPESAADYKIPDFSNSSDWHLVSVHFRDDTDELRFIYANPSAWSTISAGKTDYQDGAVFAKVAYHLQRDPMFPNSRIPSSVFAYAFMRKDSSKYAKDGGWGFTIRTPLNMVATKNEKTYDTCVACHKLAEPRGGIYSSPLPAGTSQLQFHGMKFTDIPGLFQEKEAKEFPDLMREAHLQPSDKVLAMNGGVFTGHTEPADILGSYFGGGVTETLAAFLGLKNEEKPVVAQKEDGSVTMFTYKDKERSYLCNSKPALVTTIINRKSLQEKTQVTCAR